MKIVFKPGNGEGDFKKPKDAPAPLKKPEHSMPVEEKLEMQEPVQENMPHEEYVNQEPIQSEGCNGNYQGYPDYPEYPDYPDHCPGCPDYPDYPEYPDYPNVGPDYGCGPYPYPGYYYPLQCLGYAYIPWQQYWRQYSPEEANEKGTLFPELYSPYYSDRCPPVVPIPYMNDRPPMLRKKK